MKIITKNPENHILVYFKYIIILAELLVGLKMKIYQELCLACSYTDMEY